MPGFSIPLTDPFGGCRGYRSTDTVDNLAGAEPVLTEETARAHRYVFETLEPLGKDNLLLFAFKAQRPVPEFDEITIHSGQDEIYRPGKNKWKPIEITFYERLTGPVGDLAGPAAVATMDLQDQAAKLMYEWWAGANGGASTRRGPPTSVVELDTSRQGLTAGYQKPCQLAMLDGRGEPVWTYYLSNCWPLRVTPSDISYADTAISTIAVTLRFDKAIEAKNFK